MNLISLPLTEVAPINTIMDPTMDKWWEDIANSQLFLQKLPNGCSQL